MIGRLVNLKVIFKLILGNDLNEAQLHAPAHEISLSKHSTVHKELATYAELMHWTKIMDRKAYDGLTKVYTQVNFHFEST